jgi:hypothetical protein
MKRMCKWLLAGAAIIAVVANSASTSWSEDVQVKYRGPVSLAPFTCEAITRSSFIERVCYDAKNAYMLINLMVLGTTIAKLIRAPSRAC